MFKIKAIVTDIDGTLTINRKDHKLEIEAIKAIRRAESNGIPVVLVSGNALPVVVSLSTYIGTSGPVICENGCLVFYKGKIYNVATFSSRKAVPMVMEKFKDFIEPSWQNTYRIFDFAFNIKKEFREQSYSILLKIQKFLKDRGFKDIVVSFSGYAIHLMPVSGGKDKGLLKALELMSIKKSEIICIGDGLNDVDLFRVCPFSATVSNADGELKKIATYVASKPSGRGFAEIVNYVLNQYKIT